MALLSPCSVYLQDKKKKNDIAEVVFLLNLKSQHLCEEQVWTSPLISLNSPQLGWYKQISSANQCLSIQVNNIHSYPNWALKKLWILILVFMIIFGVKHFF